MIEKTEKNKKVCEKKAPELLAPAGSLTALFAAIDGGADAVYMGGTSFNARINAKNFTSEELRDGIERAHRFGVKVYLTLNTLVYDKELDEALFAASDAYLKGADALIVADRGLAREIKKRIPMELHASTQMSGHNLASAKKLAEDGFSRMVLAREMPREDIRSLILASPIEAEVFVHGALCVCHSGQCLFSSMVGGRSGNRGECAQPCRLPFGNNQSYPLSPKDLSLAEHIPELIDMGVASFKIEGRMKSPEYVRDVTSIWRRLIDEGRAANKSDMAELSSIFSRGGFTDAYYVKNIGHHMLGTRSEEDKKATRELEPFSSLERKIPVYVEAELKEARPITLTLGYVSAPELNVTVTGDIVQTARTAPLDEERVKKNLSKLGATDYVAERVKISMDNGVMLPVSSLNSARRDAVDKLYELTRGDIRSPEDIKEAEKLLPQKKSASSRVALFYEPQNITESAKEYFDIIYLPLERYDGSTEGVMLPPVIFDSELEHVKDMLCEAKKKGARHLLYGNIGHEEIAKESGMILHGGMRLGVCNSSSAALTEADGLEDFVYSPELNLPKMRDIGGGGYAIVYGRIPLMITEKCVGKELGSCEDCKKGNLALIDRRGVRFPVMKAFSHRSLIFNSVPVYMADRKDELLKNRITMQFFIFSDESENEVDEVIESYKKSLPPKDDSKVKRIK